MPVDRPHVIEAQLLEHGAAGDEAARELLGLARLVVDEARQMRGELLGGVADGAIGAAGDEAGEIGRHGAGRRRDRHVVVVENDDEARIQRAGVVQRLIGHARRHRAVADDGDDVIVAVREVAGNRHAEAGRDRGGRMRSAERIIRAFRALGEARQPVLHAQGADAVAAPGEDLVRIGLVADVPDDLVARRVEHVVQRHRQLDDAQSRAEMAARDGHRVDGFAAQLFRELLELARLQLAQLLRSRNLVEEGGLRCRQRLLSSRLDRDTTNSRHIRWSAAPQMRSGKEGPIPVGLLRPRNAGAELSALRRERADYQRKKSGAA